MWPEVDDVDPHVVLYQQCDADVTQDEVASWNERRPKQFIEADAVLSHSQIGSNASSDKIGSAGLYISSIDVGGGALPEADDLDPHVVLYHECHGAVTESFAPLSSEPTSESCAELDTAVSHFESETKFDQSTIHDETEEYLECKSETNSRIVCANSSPSPTGLLETDDLDPHVVLYQQCDVSVEESIVPSRKEKHMAVRSSAGRCQRSASKALSCSKCPKHSHPFLILAAAWMRALQLRKVPPPAMYLPHALWFDPIISVVEPAAYRSWKDTPGCYTSPIGSRALRTRSPLAELTNLQHLNSSPWVKGAQTPCPRSTKIVAPNREVFDFHLFRVFKQQSEKLGTTLENLFRKVDLNGDGELTRSEVIEANALLGLSPDDAEKLFDTMDISKRGILSRTQFSINALTEIPRRESRYSAAESSRRQGDRYQTRDL
jgi:hypothetical protein